VTRLWTIAAIVILLAASGMGSAQQRISIPSFTPASLSTLLHHETTPTTVIGELYLPPKASGPLPALVLMHGSGGLEGPTGTDIRKWAGIFAGWGIAALVVDSFGPRGIKETGSNQDQLSEWADVADSLAAIKVPAADPRIVYFAGGSTLRRCPYISSSTYDTQLNSNNCMFFSIRRYSGMLIFQGRV
jgi:poly(3-hydroxybutyrate) depolymerase